MLPASPLSLQSPAGGATSLGLCLLACHHCQLGQEGLQRLRPKLAAIGHHQKHMNEGHGVGGGQAKGNDIYINKEFNSLIEFVKF